MENISQSRPGGPVNPKQGHHCVSAYTRIQTVGPPSLKCLLPLLDAVITCTPVIVFHLGCGYARQKIYHTTIGMDFQVCRPQKYRVQYHLNVGTIFSGLSLHMAYYRMP